MTLLIASFLGLAAGWAATNVAVRLALRRSKRTPLELFATIALTATQTRRPSTTTGARSLQV